MILKMIVIRMIAMMVTMTVEYRRKPRLILKVKLNVGNKSQR